jgi:hypothetical protein
VNKMSTTAAAPRPITAGMLLAATRAGKISSSENVSADACTNMARSRLAWVLLKTHVMTIAKKMVLTTNETTAARKPSPPDDAAQEGVRNRGTCQKAHRTPE